MNIAYLDPPYSRYFHELSARLAETTGGACVALLSSPAYRLYTGTDRALVWEPGESPARWRLPEHVSRISRPQMSDPRFARIFSHAVRWFREQLINEGIGLCLVYSDARVFSAAACVAAGELGIRCVYFERGAFRYRTASLSTHGLNGRFPLRTAAAASGIAGIAASDPLPRRPSEPWLRTRFAGFLLHNAWTNARQPQRRLLRPRNQQLGHYIRLGLKQMLSAVRSGAEASRQRWSKREGPMVFLPLQLSADTQMLLYSPFANNQALIDFVVSHVVAVAPDAQVLIKRHPMDLTDYRVPRGARLVDAGAPRVIARAAAVVCVNSTVGFEAAIAGKPVLCFGDSFYGQSDFVGRVSRSNFAGRLRIALARGDDPQAGAALRAEVLRCYQAPGDVWAYTAQDLERTARIVLQHATAQPQKAPRNPSHGRAIGRAMLPSGS